MSAPTTFICDFTEHPLVWVDNNIPLGSCQVTFHSLLNVQLDQRQLTITEQLDNLSWCALGFLRQD
jgi:hypothetical protein